MKKLINDPNRLVEELVQGYVAAYPDKIQLVGNNIITRKNPKKKGKVATVIGNGSGHEPAILGWVGYGMLDVSIPGEIFSAPGPDRILEGIRLADRGGGVLCYIANHSGDVLNANMALEMAKEQNLRVDSVLLYDDISSACPERREERRGISGIFFVFKIAGALAEEGASFSEVKSIAQKVRDNTRSLAISLSSCIMPTTGKVMFDLPEDEIEIGMGVHGESSPERIPMGTADEIVDIMASRIINDMPYREGDEILVLMSGAGSTTLMERFIMYRRLHEILEQRKIKVYKCLIRDLITTQEMAGVSLSFCKIDVAMKRLWDASADTPYFVVR